MIVPSHAEGAPGTSPLGTGDIDTMQALISTRTPDTLMTLPATCLFSEASEHRSISTGKERDSESGNDYFEARYYASSMGRFLSPDWSAKEDRVPYAHLDDPQSLNLYSYVLNNPLAKADLDGHGCPPDCSTGNSVVDFLGGAANAFGSDNTLGAGRMNQTTGAGQLGQAFGDAGAAIVGAGEFVLGTGGNVGGLALDATGVGAVAGVPANIVSTAAMVQGGAATGEGFTHLLASAIGPKAGESGGPGAGKAIGDSTKGAALDENKAANGDVSVTGQRLARYQQSLREVEFKGHIFFLIGVARPESDKSWDRRVKELRFRSGTHTQHGVICLEKAIMPDWDRRSCPWCLEARSLARLDAERAESLRTPNIPA